MGVAQRRTREREELKRRILDSATRLFVEEGYDKVTIRRIADDIEYSPATIYLHFKDKDALMASICEETFRQLDAVLEAIRLKGMDPLATLRQSLIAYIRFGLDHPNEYLLTFCTPPPKNIDGALDEGVKGAMDAGMVSFGRLREGLRACQEAGVTLREDVEKQAQIVWMMLHGMVSLFVLDCGFPFIDREVLIQSHVSAIMRALKP